AARRTRASASSRAIVQSASCSLAGRRSTASARTAGSGCCHSGRARSLSRIVFRGVSNGALGLPTILQAGRVPFLEIPRSPLAPGLSPLRLHYRRHGHGPPLVFLHSGWGYGVYPFDRQQAAFEEDHEILAPDRSGYGGSPRLTRFAEPLHDAAAVETLLFMDALGLERASLWGHSDGAVIAALVRLPAPQRVSPRGLEAIQGDGRRRGSRAFFEELREPERADPRLAAMLAADHGEDYWREVWRMEGEAWLRILDTADDPSRDLYHGRLG